MDKKSRSDTGKQRKVSVSQLAQAINEVLPSLGVNKVGKLPKSVLYQVLLERNYFTRAQLAPTTFYRFVREHELLNLETTEKLRMAFAMQHANEMWQGDTMHGPAIKQADGSWKKTYFIAFIDDASRLITHGEFFYADDTVNMLNAFEARCTNVVSPSACILTTAVITPPKKFIKPVYGSIFACLMPPFAMGRQKVK